MSEPALCAEHRLAAAHRSSGWTRCVTGSRPPGGGVRGPVSRSTSTPPPSPHRPLLLRELLALELDYRLQEGETPRPAEYQHLFPGYGELIAEVFREVPPAEPGPGVPTTSPLGGAPRSASAERVTDDPCAADESPSPWPFASTLGATVMGGSAAPWNPIWSASAGR